VLDNGPDVGTAVAAHKALVTRIPSPVTTLSASSRVPVIINPKLRRR